MILPSKHLGLDRSLFSIGARVLDAIHEETTVSSLWIQLQGRSTSLPATDKSTLSFDWFVLALDFLFIAGAVEIKGGVIRRVSS